ncbi:alpha/beta hydrolase [Actinomyces lilanjuaniae]|uniref:Alpha/beta hydrolase n=1 Tax=Actinomyces lilanjuaniae TaxID=2321394 RepID=A0ABN5PM03_9ACTO|nr:alpha/beta hydrolase [Actinomyces lilanjuaniae]AYD89295.1 alpha/beta hydrolase [Actinomyces lilanjuaniae]
MKSVLLRTALGPVEVLLLPGEKPPVAFFPGGHCTARSDCGWSLYTTAGHGVIAFSRPGYGRTAVGDVTAAEFCDAVAACCRQLGVPELAAAVGVSLGGLQAIELAVRHPGLVPRLVLSSSAPSSRPYPDDLGTILTGSLVFSPVTQELTWSAVARLVSTDAGLRLMVSSLSTRPADQWWDSWSQKDRHRARELFTSMSSGRGFMLDMRQGRATRTEYRRQLLGRVPCPALVTGSRTDGAVSITHAWDLAARIPGAALVELDTPTHLFWLGPGQERVHAAVASFLSR